MSIYEFEIYRVLNKETVVEMRAAGLRVREIKAYQTNNGKYIPPCTIICGEKKDLLEEWSLDLGGTNVVRRQPQ